MPGTSVSVWPRYAVPATAGAASGTGGSIAWAIWPVAAEVAEPEPTAFVPVWRTRIVRLTSSVPRR